MNRKRFRELADVIEQHGELYLQASAGVGRDPRECGTPACALGWAAALWAGHVVPGGESIRLAGGEALGLDVEESDQLFYGVWPAIWFRAAGLGPKLKAEGKERRAELTPSVADAVQILRWMSGLERFPMVNARGRWYRGLPIGVELQELVTA